MSKLGARAFDGTRVRLQRASDAKILNGWMLQLADQRANIRVRTTSPVQIGERFACEAFGHHTSAAFMATLAGVARSGPPTSAEHLEDQGVKLLAYDWTILELEVEGTIRCQSSHEPVRLCAHGVRAQVRHEGQWRAAEVIDLALGGVGLAFSEPLTPRSKIDLRLETKLGSIQASGEVRYCRPCSEVSGAHRLGVMFLALPRVQAPLWAKLITG